MVSLHVMHMLERFADLMTVQNDVKLDFLGIKTFTLHHYDSPPLLEGCHLYVWIAFESRETTLTRQQIRRSKANIQGLVRSINCYLRRQQLYRN
jgi:hypothetical protein